MTTPFPTVSITNWVQVLTGLFPSNTPFILPILLNLRPKNLPSLSFPHPRPLPELSTSLALHRQRLTGLRACPSSPTPYCYRSVHCTTRSCPCPSSVSNPALTAYSLYLCVRPQPLNVALRLPFWTISSFIPAVSPSSPYSPTWWLISFPPPSFSRSAEWPATLWLLHSCPVQVPPGVE